MNQISLLIGKIEGEDDPRQEIETDTTIVRDPGKGIISGIIRNPERRIVHLATKETDTKETTQTTGSPTTDNVHGL